MLELLGANRSSCPTVLAPVIAILAVFVFTASPAHAHFILNTPGAWETAVPGDGAPQKLGPCGNEPGGTPTGTVTDYQPGQTITITVTPTIAHPGWWRVALIQGPSSTQTTTSLADPAYTAAGVSVGTTTCLAAVPATISNPVWSPTQPVILDGVAAQNATPEHLQVTLPQNITCTAQRPCALQVIMIMNDGHITAPNGAQGCYYHHCADITIGAGGADAGASSSSSGGSSGSGSSGASTSSGSGGSSSSGAAGSSGSSGTSGTAGGSSGSSGSLATTGDGGGSAAATGQGMPSSNGCGCVLAPGGATPTAVRVAALLGLAALTRRRRRR